ncbi:MAG: hypothetical protein ACJA1A_001051 [Saprospiraceae bacterium]|jgi:hypothetical protein|tara:strand:+ start:1491 stop:1706 length:216 start_codon:yes stop_codon:yes gene_type:complete
MDLVFKKKSLKIEAIEGRLKSLSLAFKLIESENADLPSLVDGKKSYIGLYKMNRYIDKLDQEKEKWYYCAL